MTNWPAVGLVAFLANLATAAAHLEGPGVQSAVPRHVVVLELRDEADRTVTASVAVGRSVTLSRTGLPTLRITPTLAPDGLLKLAGSLSPAGDDAPQAGREGAASAMVPLSGTTHLEIGTYELEITWLDDKTDKRPAGMEADEASECCVVCDGIKTCACRVQAPCGRCCDQQCGGCDQADGLPCGDTEYQRKNPTPEKAGHPRTTRNPLEGQSERGAIMAPFGGTHW